MGEGAQNWKEVTFGQQYWFKCTPSTALGSLLCCQFAPFGLISPQEPAAVFQLQFLPTEDSVKAAASACKNFQRCHPFQKQHPPASWAETFHIDQT